MPSASGRPRNPSSVGVTSLSTPSRIRRPFAADPASRNGTRLSECAVTTAPAASRITSALPWSAVIASSAPGPPAATDASSTASSAVATRSMQPSSTSQAATVAAQTPVWPTMSGLAKLATMRS